MLLRRVVIKVKSSLMKKLIIKLKSHFFHNFNALNLQYPTNDYKLYFNNEFLIAT
jgi:hypothetical protein